MADLSGGLGGNHNIYNYLAYPRRIGGYFSIGVPFYDGDVYTREMSASEWMNALSDAYEYVALHHVNDYFVENYSNLFSDPSRVMDGTLWMVDTDNGKLVEVGN